MLQLQLIPQTEFKRIYDQDIDVYLKMKLIAAMCRFNTLTMVKKAGSGHLGSSLSAMDLVVWLYYQTLNVKDIGLDAHDRDIYFSSKGHDVPGLYSVLYSLGFLKQDKILQLRRINGLDGHPHVSIPGCEVNSGSLGMGISKAKGIAIAKKLQGRKGSVYVMTGDGELQEGQNYEAMRFAANHNIDITVIIDHNKVQSDKQVFDIAYLGNVEHVFKSFGWHVQRCKGHDFKSIHTGLDALSVITDMPKVLIADTIKGSGISFMEHPFALNEGNGIYAWHSGAPDDESFEKASAELSEKIAKLAKKIKLRPIEYTNIENGKKSVSTVTKEFVKDAYGETVCALAKENEKIVVLDADLADDCRVRTFENTYPDRFIECGIAEQDMVSTAGGLALHGFVPIANSFASFLASRANEQMYNNATEKTKIIYACHYAGLIPAGPGLSHQSIRDISLFSALPNCTIIQPCNSEEMRRAVHFAVNECEENCMLRIAIGPSPRHIDFDNTYTFSIGEGTVLREGSDAILFSYGPVMIHEALCAQDVLQKEGISLKVVNMPWLNRFSHKWLSEVIGDIPSICILEDHSVHGGLGEHVLHELNDRHLLHNRTFSIYGLETFPAWGTPNEVLEHHGLDGASIAKRIMKAMEHVHVV